MAFHKFLLIFSFLFTWCGIGVAEMPATDVVDEITFEFEISSCHFDVATSIVLDARSIYFDSDLQNIDPDKWSVVSPSVWIVDEYTSLSLSDYPLQLYHFQNTFIMGKNNQNESGNDPKVEKIESTNDPNKDKLESTETTAAAKTTEYKYKGPKYNTVVHLPEIGACDPVNWDQERIRDVIINHPNLVRYF